MRIAILSVFGILLCLSVGCSPDLTPKDLNVDVDDGVIVLGKAIGDRISLSVENKGNADAGKFQVAYYLSEDADITADDLLLDDGRVIVPGLTRGTETAVALTPSASLPESAPTGSVWLGAVVDDGNAVNERSETNNAVAVSVMVAPPSVPTTTSHDFLIDSPDTVAYDLFHVLQPGTISIEVNWTGASTDLMVELTGRRRPALADPTEPYAQATGTSPLSISYTATPDDLARGVGWRAVVRDPSGTGDAKGTLSITVPFSPTLEPMFQREKIALRSGDIWPSAALQKKFLGALPTAPDPGRHAIVSTVRDCNCVQNRALRKRGVDRQTFFPGRHAYSLVEKGAALTSPRIAGIIRAITPIEPEDKIDPDILLGNYNRFRILADQGPTNMVKNAAGQLELTVLFARDVNQSQIAAVLAANAITSEALSDRQWHATVLPDKLVSLAEADETEWIGAGPAPAVSDLDRTRLTINANGVHNANINAAANTATYNGLSGNGVTVGIQDTGVDGTHTDLNVVAAINPNPDGSHGTHVAGIAAGSGVRSALTAANPTGAVGAAFQWRGIAPQAGLIEGGNLDTAADLSTAINTNSMDAMNRSQSITIDGEYSPEDVRIDAHIRGGSSHGGRAVPRRPESWSAGNNGVWPQNIRPAAAAAAFPMGANLLVNGGQSGFFSLTKQHKNAVVVGNWDAVAGDLSAGSSMGPAHDGRIKPDIVAPGTAVTSSGTVGDDVCIAAGTNLSNGYTACGGTSMSAPAAAGTMALLLEGWQNTYNAPLGLTLDDNPPLPSTLRSILIQTADDLNIANVRNLICPDVDGDSNAANGNQGNGTINATAGPDYATGWGQLNAQAATDLLLENRTVDGMTVPNRIIQDRVNQAVIREYDFAVAAAGPIRITLAWDDVEGAAANPATDPMLINDLDLELVAPDGVTIFYPWQLGHTIEDPAGNPLANNAQPPGTPIEVIRDIMPINNPTNTWTVVAGAGGGNAWAWANTNNVDYVPQNALNAGGDWVARQQGKDHLNNVEQVQVNVAAGQVGHWIARVIGFDVQADGQDFSLVGMPYPDLPELVAACDNRVGLPAFGTAVSFDWEARNIGDAATGGTFNHEIVLSRNFYRDAGDIVLADTHATAGTPFPALGTGLDDDRTSTVTITQANADALMGSAGTTVDDLIDEGVFLLACVDPADTVLEHNESNNCAYVQFASLVDVVLVMDRSGSMRSSVTTSLGTRTKLQVLQRSAGLFLDLLRQDLGDRLGEVAFGTNSSVVFDDGSGSVENFGAGNIGAARGAVNALVAQGNTNIRAALQDALDLIPAAGDRRRVVVFLSDGMKTAGGDPAEVAFLNQFDTQNIKVFSVGFGTEGASGNAGLDIPLLQTLSNVGDNGFFHVTQTATGLDKFFINALAGASGEEVIIDPVGSLAEGTREEIDIPVSSEETAVTFVATWDDPSQSLGLRVRTPQGVDINSANMAAFGPRVSRKSAPGYEIFTVHLPLAVGVSQAHTGTWAMVLENPGPGTIRYSASAIAETGVRALQEVELPAGGVFNPGDPVRLTTRAGTAGTPLVDADVRVFPMVPSVGIGNVLSAAGLVPAEISAVPAAIEGDTLPLRDRMYMALWRRLGRDPAPAMAGSQFDLAESPKAGIYEGEYEVTRTPGVYTFTTHLSGLLPDCSPVVRETVQTVLIGGRVDPVVSEIDLIGDEGGNYTLTVTPRDSGGNLVGPGLVENIQVTATGLRDIGPLEDGFDGSYRQRFAPDRHGVATVSVVALGVPLPVKSVDLAAPSVVDVSPPGGSAGTDVTVTVSPGGTVTGIVFSGEDRTVSVTGVEVDANSGSVSFKVPADLAPGRYALQVQTGQAAGPMTDKAVFQVVGDDRQLPRSLQALDSAIAQAFSAKKSAGWSQLLRALLDLPVGPSLSQKSRLAALKEAIQLNARGVTRPNDKQLKHVLEARRLARQDARPKGF
jgi:subtilisin family serine protease